MDSRDEAPNVRFYRSAERFLSGQPIGVVADIIGLAAQLWHSHDVDGEQIFLVPTPPGFHRVYIGDRYWILFRHEGDPPELKVIDVGLVGQDEPPAHI